jgi:hypothetical protein
MVVDVTRPPYSAKGDGVTDDTEALQRALNENVGRHRAVFLPRGSYLVSRTLTWPKRWNGRDNWGMTIVRGESRDGTVLRLKDRTFTNAAKPEAIMWCGGFGSADWFHNYVEQLTFDVGAGNPGATALPGTRRRRNYSSARPRPTWRGYWQQRQGHLAPSNSAASNF